MNRATPVTTSVHHAPDVVEDVTFQLLQAVIAGS
jgi:hypothetical protein